MSLAKSEFSEKLERVAQLLDQEKLDGLVLSTQANFAWFTCGGSSHVNVASETGVAHVVVGREKSWVICENIEKDRIATEEVADLNLPVVSYDWWTGGQRELIEELIGSRNYGTDTGIFGSRNVEPQLAPFRYSLTPQEIDRYRWVARNVAECMDQTCRAVSPGMSEFEIAGRLNESITARGTIPQVTLIAADERIASYRHPIPTEKKVEKYAMLVTGARRWGLIVSMSRLVHFGQLPEGLRTRHVACTRVDAEFIHSTRPGNSIGGIFARGVEAYAEAGFPGEWRLHHQGGPTGYKGRELRAVPGMVTKVRPNQAYAWNPSITGTKSEDTIIATPERTEVMTDIPGWPTVEVEVDGAVYNRPAILVR